MEITSPAFKMGEKIPKKYTCDGENVSPPLKFFEVPENAKSLVLMIEDPDAPAGLWTHWTVWNIKNEFDGIPEGNVPEGAIEGLTTSGKTGYSGPCPPSGTHQYIFRLYALSSLLEIPETTRPDELKNILRGKVIEEAELTGNYRR